MISRTWRWPDARASAVQLSDLAPPEYRADLVVRIEGRRGRLHHMVVLEAQLQFQA